MRNKLIPIAVYKPVPIVALLALLVMGCQTIPRQSDPVANGSGLIPLESGALVYALADVSNARPLLEMFPLREIGGEQIGQILDRTQSAVIALYPRESGRRLQIAAWGNFPTGRADMAFAMNREWKKARSKAGYSYWYSGAGKFSVAMNARQAYAASGTEMPVEPVSLGPPVQSPRDFIAISRGASLSCWLENPGAAVNRVFEALGLPLQLPAERMYAGFFPAESADGSPRYTARLRIETQGESQARALVTLFSMARVFVPRQPREDGSASLAAILFANAPAQDGKYVNMETSPLGEKDITLLFSYFSLYSDTL